MAEEGSTALLPCQFSAMDNLLWELKPEHKVLQERAPLTPVVFEQGQEQKVFWMSFTAKHLPKIA